MDVYQPLVSIVIPVYNGANYLAQAIDSALAQTYRNIEVIVVNDGSRDDGATERIALSYGNKIRYFSKPNGGVSSALNLGIEHMQGDYFSWLSHDDLYAPSKIEHQVALLDRDKPKTIAYCGTELVNKDLQPIPRINRGGLKPHMTGNEMFKRCFGMGVSLSGCALLIPKQAFAECGNFASLVYSQDMECWSRFMISGYDFVVSAEKLVYSRVHAGQVTNTSHDKYLSEQTAYIKMLVEYALTDKEMNEFALHNLLIYAYRNNNKQLVEFISRYTSLGVINRLRIKLKRCFENICRYFYHRIIKNRKL